MEYGEWKTGIRNDGFQYAFVSLGNKVGMADPKWKTPQSSIKCRAASFGVSV